MNTAEKKFKILLVDDKLENIKLALAILEKENYHVYFATSGQQAIQMLEDNVAEFDFILLDIMMPEMNGFETCQHIKSNPSTKDIPIIFITAKTDGESIKQAYSLGGLDYICKPFYAAELLMKLKTHLSLIQAKNILSSQKLDLAKKLNHLEESYVSDIQKSQNELLSVLQNIVNYSRNVQNKNSFLITELAAKITQLHPFLDDEDVKIIKKATPLYDIGKLLKKEDSATNDTELEHVIKEEYTTKGYWILKTAESHLLQKAATIAFSHREFCDGSGSPQGLKGDEIDIYARIVCLAVVVYEKFVGINESQPLSIAEIAEYVRRFDDFKFDSLLVKIFLSNIDDFAKILDPNLVNIK